MNTLENQTKTRLVGIFIRQRREAVKLSQRALGLLFNPPVTTQFISNLERGVTPLPLNHVPTLTKALQIEESEMLGLLEKEYTLKVSGRLSKLEGFGGGFTSSLDKEGGLPIYPEDLQFMKLLYEAYRKADLETRQNFHTVCESVLTFKK